MSDPVSTGNTDHALRMADGRRLAYAEYGAPAGMPALFFHGAPGSRLSIFGDMNAAAAQRGVRLIVPERPGYGLSDPLSGRTVRDWTDDVLTLTDALGVERFKIIGFSMGSLYALACAHALPQRVKRVAVAGSLAPLSVQGVSTGRSDALRSLYALAQTDPHGLRRELAPLADSATLFAVMAASAPAVDQALLAAHRSWFEADFAESIRGGIEGMACDVALAAGEWTFPLEQIQASVDLWLGTEDCITPPAMARHLASVLPHNQLFELPGEGHYCLYSRWHQILDRLAA